MGLLSNLMGNASELKPEELEKEFGPILCEGEQIEAAFKLWRDKWVFTNRRLIMQDIQGMTGSKKEYHSLPYRAITHFLVETAGTFDGDCELEIWVSGVATPFKQELKRGIDVVGLQKTLAKYICK
ncbi:MAG: PH domain-containing protein [Bacteroidetes bacterium]|nr:PH domain-containing protein [Bacteroidota bacterium]MDA0943647.1 PH domain-containing protein [Bacteroidota bacterium]MDA1111572.1 PH domain-containing protein [Bacteroidota bacterium]